MIALAHFRNVTLLQSSLLCIKCIIKITIVFYYYTIALHYIDIHILYIDYIKRVSSLFTFLSTSPFPSLFLFLYPSFLFSAISFCYQFPGLLPVFSALSQLSSYFLVVILCYSLNAIEYFHSTLLFCLFHAFTEQTFIPSL